jgi:hypothetical protein
VRLDHATLLRVERPRLVGDLRASGESPGDPLPALLDVVLGLVAADRLARVGNEPWFVHSSADSRGISIGQGGRAETPTVCLTLLDPTARYFTRGSAGGRLQVDVIGHAPLGLNLVLGSTTLTGTGAWSVSDVQHFLANLTSVATWTISLRCTAVSGTWQVDDVYLDPMLQR